MTRRLSNYEKEIRRGQRAQTPRVKRQCVGGPYDGHFLRLTVGEERSALIKVGKDRGRYIGQYDDSDEMRFVWVKE